MSPYSSDYIITAFAVFCALGLLPSGLDSVA